MLDLSRAYNKNFRHDKSLELAQKAAEMARAKHDDEQLEEAYRLTANSLMGLKREAEAVEYYKKIAHINSSTLCDNDLQNMALA